MTGPKNNLWNVIEYIFITMKYVIISAQQNLSSILRIQYGYMSCSNMHMNVHFLCMANWYVIVIIIIIIIRDNEEPILIHIWLSRSLIACFDIQIWTVGCALWWNKTEFYHMHDNVWSGAFNTLSALAISPFCIWIWMLDGDWVTRIW